MDEATRVFRELSGKPDRPEPPARRKRERSGRNTTRTTVAPRNKQPRASERASVAAQDWYDRGTAHGFTFPYDVNYLALGIQKRVENDPRMKKLINDGDKVDRWLAKMNANWWEHYVDATVTASNAKDLFLGDDWEDLRDWAHGNLRKDYILKHGKPVPPPLYPNQQEYQQRLEELRKRTSVETFIKRLDEDDPMPQRREIDPADRERLRSWVDRRKQMRRERGTGR